ncbi:GGDEF domain-containing protein [Acidisphaera sp. S103]|uniref:GGDEF domain-containing protein n=1 Tax=Acidisphaera sp. S103 TaxID=1747223 RepID=UPI00131C0781|nr:GGDEF domain-containing protein [Acidisphaera sp. S103]
MRKTIRWLTILSMGVASGMLALGAIVLLDAREDAWQQAKQASANLALVLERDIARNIALYDLSLQGVITALQQPDIDQVSPQIRHMAVFDSSASGEDLGSILVLNTAGSVVEDSTSIVPHTLNLADRDYFRVQEERPDIGLYVSRPFLSRLRGGDASIAISRRIPASDGRFGGVVMGALRVAYFQKLFEKLNLGPGGSVTLIGGDGRLIARYPVLEADFNRDMSNSTTFRKFAAAPQGSFEGASSYGVRRLYTYQHIGNLPLILSVALSVDEIYSAWWRKTLIVATILVVLCGATVALCLLFRREMLRRLAAEGALVEAADKLSVIAATDGLTGLANRRAFDARLRVEWNRAIRAETPIALLMLDADCFKLYNDGYGHQEGDRVLQMIATCIQKSIRRPGDLGARYGGEEFVAVLPNTDWAGASTVAEAIRSAVEGLDIPHAGSPSGRLTVSIGVAVARPLLGEAESLIVKEADDALYDAKHAGRNRVNTAGRDDPPIAMGLAEDWG